VAATGFFIVAAFVLAMGVGWIMNIFKLASCDFTAPYRCEIVHAVGLIPIIGLFTGWINIEENSHE
jgi:hypothetical protein